MWLIHQRRGSPAVEWRNGDQVQSTVADIPSCRTRAFDTQGLACGQEQEVSTIDQGNVCGLCNDCLWFPWFAAGGMHLSILLSRRNSCRFRRRTLSFSSSNVEDEMTNMALTAPSPERPDSGRSVWVWGRRAMPIEEPGEEVLCTIR